VNKRNAGALERTAACAFLDPNKTVSKPAHLSVERTPKRSRVPDAGAGSLDCALAEVGRKERKGLTGLFGFIGFSCPTLHLEMPKIRGMGTHMVADAWSCVSAPTRSKGRVAEVTKPQPTPFPKAKSFAVQLITRFWIALHGSINIPAIRQTQTVGMMLWSISRANSHEKTGNGSDE
jgi:hypothetical protein